ncbi:MAG: hypothetical protein QF515_12855 [Pseudomonadales bacterium]|nr:hypothetical protein [Pseudomonadales bacterium]MDP6827979.1 hypothetical protein [Pseudomonadales bacterium]
MEDPHKVEMETPLVAESMARRQIGAALVTRRSKQTRIFTVLAVCEAFAAHLRRQFPTRDGPPEVD